MTARPPPVADGAGAVGGGVPSVFGCPAADDLGRGVGNQGVGGSLVPVGGNRVTDLGVPVAFVGGGLVPWAC